MCGDDALWDSAAPGLQTGGGILQAISKLKLLTLH